MLKKNFEDKKIVLNTTPAVIHLESVRGCPFDCAMCSLGNTKSVDISMDLLKKLEPYYDGLEVLSIHGGGEPLLSRHLEYFVEKSHQHKFVIHMNTTGELLSKQKSELLAKAYGLSIRFSIHAGRPESYHKIIGGDLERVSSKIKYLIDQTEDKNHDLWFSYIVMKQTIDEIEDFLRMAHRSGIKSVRFMRLNPSKDIVKGTTKRDFHLKYFEQFNRQIVQTFLARLPRYLLLASELGITIEHGSMNQFQNSDVNLMGDFINKASRKFFHQQILPLIPKKGSCIIPWYGQLIVTIEGDVKMCVQSSAHLGNLYENSLEEIWNGSIMQGVRRAFSHGRYHKICGYCKGLGLDNFPNNSFQTIRQEEAAANAAKIAANV